jgi:poly(ADP-ribose) glycohydrolase ARH3
VLLDRFVGCLLGLALGDALGAPCEGGVLERLLWRLMGKTRSGAYRFTDDTQMSLDLADSLIARGRLDQDDLAARFAASYRWSRGYGPGAAKVLRRIRGGTPWQEASRSVHPAGSFGNGAAMRAPVIGLFYAHDHAALIDAARASAEITHAHPLGQAGAIVIAVATATALTTRDRTQILEASARHGDDAAFESRFAIARTWLSANAAPSPAEVRRRLGTGIVATESCVTAIHIALRFLDAPFEDLLAFVRVCGGDVDTIGAMAGALWGAANGAQHLPASALEVLEHRARIENNAIALHRASDERISTSKHDPSQVDAVPL